MKNTTATDIRRFIVDEEEYYFKSVECIVHDEEKDDEIITGVLVHADLDEFHDGDFIALDVTMPEDADDAEFLVTGAEYTEDFYTPERYAYYSATDNDGFYHLPEYGIRQYRN